MSTRIDKHRTGTNSIPMGYEGDDIPQDIEVPECTIEDVDRALFNLFNEDLPMFYQQKKDVKRVPVIFATGERFALLSRKKPLRDNSGALILPLVSIMRTGIAQDVARGMGPGQGGPLTIRKRLAKEDPRYQRLKNKLGLANQDNLSHSSHRVGNDPDRDIEEGTSKTKPTGANPGQLASRRKSNPRSNNARSGRLLAPDISDNIFEVVTMPPVKYFNASYEITFWAQYTQQMNGMIQSMMSLYQNNHIRTFRIETDKGYWFVAYIASELASNNNHDDFSDDERLVRYTFTIEVPAYLIMPEQPGIPMGIRRFVSAPTISFESTQTRSQPYSVAIGGTVSGNPDSYILQDMFLEHMPLPGDAIGVSGVHSTIRAAGGDILDGSIASSDARDLTQNNDNLGEKTASVGRSSSGRGSVQIVRMEIDPFTGERRKALVRIKGRNQRKGETVYREGITSDMDALNE